MTPHYLELFDQLLAAPDDKTRMEILDRNAEARKHIPKSRPVMPPYGRKRHSLTQLIPRHLEWIERLANRPSWAEGSRGRPGYERCDMHEHFCSNYTRFFAPLRGSLAKDVPSDEFRRWWMINNLLDLVDERRRQIEEAKQPTTF